MKNIIFAGICSAFLCLVGCSQKITVEQLKTFTATETYPKDSFLDSVLNKKALIIVAHDDDDCAMSGTIAKLTANGWKIKQLSLTSHLMDNSDKNAAGIICEGNELILPDGAYRLGLDTMKTAYLPIPKSEFAKQFLTEKVANTLITKVNDFNPSVIFTLDNVKGGYGHPEHIFVSQLVLELFEAKKIKVQRIYQSVYPPSMEQEIVDKWLKAQTEKWGVPHTSSIANALYGIKGMPEPNTQMDIQAQGEKKMQYLRAYPENVRKNLRKFIPYYEEFDAKTYFSIFNREFFRVIAH